MRYFLEGIVATYWLRVKFLFQLGADFLSFWAGDLAEK
jgi:hypothetical protein